MAISKRLTGYKINWKKFDSGAKVITAMASGDVHISLAGSSPIAAGVSRGLADRAVLDYSRTSTTPKRWSYATGPASRSLRT